MNERQRQKRQFWIVLLIVFFGFVGISMPYLIFPALFLNKGYSILPAAWGDGSRALFLGITLAAYPLGQFLGSPILGSLSDDYGRKKLLSTSLLVASFANFLSGMAIASEYLTLLIASRFIAGLMEGNIAIARAIAADITTISKHRTFGKINAVASIAFLLGPLLGGLMTEKDLFEGLTASSPFYLTAILFLFLSLLSTTMLDMSPTPHAIIHKKSFVERINLFKRLKTLFLNKHLQFLLIVSTCFTLAVDIFYEFGPVYLTVKWGLSPRELILYNGLLCLALAVGNGWLPTLISPYFSNRKIIISSIGGFAFFLAVMLFTNSISWMMFLFCFSGFMIGLAVTLLTVNISNTVAGNIQGEVMGVQISLRVLGDAVICLCGGVLLMVSSKIILVLASLMSLFAMIYYANKTVYAIDIA